MGLRGVAAGANPSLASGRGQDAPWTSRQLIAGPHWWAMWGSVSRTLQHAAQPCPEPGFEPATFWSLVDLLYPLSYRDKISIHFITAVVGYREAFKIACKIKHLCQQCTLNVIRDMTRSMRALEREIVALQDLAAFTGEGERIKVLKRKKSALSDLLGFSAQRALVRSHFQYVAKMDAPSDFFFGLEQKNGQKKTHASAALTLGSCCRSRGR